MGAEKRLVAGEGAAAGAGGAQGTARWVTNHTVTYNTERGLEKRGTGKAWWVEQCVNHSPALATANPSTVPMHGPEPRGGMGAPRGRGSHWEPSS